MSTAQWTVVGMILVLIGLEAIRSKNVQTFLTSIWKNFNTALNNSTSKGS